MVSICLNCTSTSKRKLPGSYAGELSPKESAFPDTWQAWFKRRYRAAGRKVFSKKLPGVGRESRSSAHPKASMSRETLYDGGYAMYILDTNVCIGILNRSSQSLLDRVHSCSPDEISLSSVVKAELYFGARRSSRVQENLKVLARFFSPFRTYPFDDPCAEHYGSIRADLVRSGDLIGPNDLLIAATARAHDLTLVTNKTREFSRVVGLRMEDWQS